MNNPDKPASLADEFERIIKAWENEDESEIHDPAEHILDFSLRNRAHILAALREYEAKHAG